MSQNFKKKFFRQFQHSTSCRLSPDVNSDRDQAGDQQDEMDEIDEVVLRLLEGDIDQKKVLRQQKWLLADRGAIEPYVYLNAVLILLSNFIFVL